MKLVVSIPCGSVDDNPKTPLYNAAKNFYSQLGSMGTCSIQVLQAGILIALYELGHAMYPAAYMSIGSCARYGTAFGFDNRGMCIVGASDNWMDKEERNRAWWAIMILDR